MESSHKKIPHKTRKRDRRSSYSRSRSRTSNNACSSPGNRKNEDREGCLVWRQGDEIRDKRYRVIDAAGQGTFGTVLDVYDTKHRERIALKVIRSVKRYLDAAYIEIEILEKLRKLDPQRGSMVVRLYGAFSTRINRQKHVCIAFEKLGPSLYDFIKRNRYRGFTLDHVRIIGRQIIHAVRFCHACKLTHTDLKLENVLLEDSRYEVIDTPEHLGYRVPKNLRIRLIDFGGATFEKDRHAKIINTRQYRGPEVLFGLAWSYPSDLWSIGCMIAEIYSGELLFQTHSDGEHLALMEKILGKKLPKSMVREGLEPFINPSRETRLPEAPLDKIFDLETNEIRWPEIAKSRESERHVRKSAPLEELVKDTLLCNLMSECLVFDPNKRVTCKEAFEHPFFRELSRTDYPMKFMDIEERQAK